MKGVRHKNPETTAAHTYIRRRLLEVFPADIHGTRFQPRRANVDHTDFQIISQKALYPTAILHTNCTYYLLCRLMASKKGKAATRQEHDIQYSSRHTYIVCALSRGWLEETIAKTAMMMSGCARPWKVAAELSTGCW